MQKPFSYPIFVIITDDEADTKPKVSQLEAAHSGIGNPEKNFESGHPQALNPYRHGRRSSESTSQEGKPLVSVIPPIKS